MLGKPYTRQFFDILTRIDNNFIRFLCTLLAAIKSFLKSVILNVSVKFYGMHMLNKDVQQELTCPQYYMPLLLRDIMLF